LANEYSWAKVPMISGYDFFIRILFQVYFDFA
jgi:hypothetical protein